MKRQAIVGFFIVIALAAGSVFLFKVSGLTSKLKTTVPSTLVPLEVAPSPTLTPPTYQVNTIIPKNWRRYSNAQGHFSIFYPPKWQVIANKPEYDSDEKSYEQRITIEGAEGKIQIYWTTGSYGSGGYDAENAIFLNINGEKRQMSRSIGNDGLEYFGQLQKATSFPDKSSVWRQVDARVKEPYAANRDIVLSALTSVKFD